MLEFVLLTLMSVAVLSTSLLPFRQLEFKAAALPRILKALSVMQLKKIRADRGNKVAKHVFSPTQYRV